MPRSEGTKGDIIFRSIYIGVLPSSKETKPRRWFGNRELVIPIGRLDGEELDRLEDLVETVVDVDLESAFWDVKI